MTMPKVTRSRLLMLHSYPQLHSSLSNCCLGHQLMGERLSSGVLMQVVLKTFPWGAAMGAVQRQVQLLQHACRRSRYLCRVHGMTTLDQRPCVVLDLYPHTVAAQLMSLPGKSSALQHALFCNQCVAFSAAYTDQACSIPVS